jgi:hypothetical protein
MVTFTEHLRLCYSSMSIWRLNFISFMRLVVQPTAEVNVSRRCTDRRVPVVHPASTDGGVTFMNANSTVRHGVIVVGVTLAIAIGVYMAVMLSLFNQ